MSYVPGPWRVVCESAQRPWAVMGTDDGEDVYVAEVVPYLDDEATAHLIAAAPEMLEALKNARGILLSNSGDADPDIRTAVDLMSAAIAKARGGY